MTEAMCDKKHGVWRWIIGVAIPVLAYIAGAAFNTANAANREIGETKVQVSANAERIVAIERRQQHFETQLDTKLDAMAQRIIQEVKR